ncbi:M4 family metallopeptidase [Aliikangiella coralliicola]|uniref:Peptidase M4 n=1 Tax=Aliikangiella coralliicola TaxID=2592383 RepID=A0A545UJW1_9GAMM|nr:M4 family metallopeptidase [Aliikangiella coralliicola]TQV89736.1 peptidase M4 [Aliikangiella coralliicola]
MNYKTNIKTLPMLIGATFTALSFGVSANNVDSLQIKNQTNSGSPSFVTGNLGDINSAKAVQSLKNILSANADYGYTGNEDFQIKRQWVDSLGKSHTHFSQTINGLKVYGSSLIIHSETSVSSINSSNTTGNVYAISGTLAVDSSPSITTALASSNDGGQSAINAASLLGDVDGQPELAYVYLPESGTAKLAWKLDVKYQSANGFEHDIVFIDAHTNQELTRHPQVHRAKVYKTYTMDNQAYNSGAAPGRLLCSTGQSCSDASAQRAHSGASTVYDYYQSRHGRDGINNNGMTMTSSVHTGSRWNNAVWYQNQMFYGDGDGNTFGDLTGDFDIIAHELTHGVTQFTAGLIYRNESGALNEAMSDIIGVSAEAYKNGTSSPAWLLGDGAYTPNTPGDALRYMDDPTKDGRSRDYYPDRYQGSQDNGGVHWNSGIANLAYSLLVDGGTHPKGKTTAQVPSIGVAKAEKIFYRALTTYFNQSTNFAAARTGTAQAAQDLYGATEKAAVETAWCAVGVGECPGTPPPPGGNELENGVAKTGLSATTGNDLKFTMDVPAGATDIKFEMSGGSGDADIYVKFGSEPTDSSYDCRPYKNGNSESCTGTQTGGTYYVRVKAYSSFSGVSLTGSFNDGGNPPGNEPINDTVNNISVNQGQWSRYTQVLPTGYSTMTVTISGGSGDADLYVRHGAQSTTSQYDCRPYRNGNNETCSFNSPAAGTWYIDIRGYSNASGVTLNLQANP